MNKNIHGKVKKGIGVQSPPEACFVIGLYVNWVSV